VKYYDHNNINFVLEGHEITWLAGATDAGIDILIRHHKATGWTYNAAAPPTFPAALCSLATEYAAESSSINGEQGAYKRTNIDTAIAGSGSEGILIELVTTGAATYEQGTAIVLIRSS
jgi:hypothetical protein